MTTPAATTEPVWDAVDASTARETTLQELAKAADGLYVAPAIIAGVQVCHCPPGSVCDCPPDGLVVANDAADSASWSLRARGLDDLEKRFHSGMRLRVVVEVEHGDPFVVGALAPK